MHNPHLLSLLQLADSTLPIGGYAHSGGLETYVQQKTIHDAASARRFITQMLERNIRFTDAAFVSLAWEAAGDGIKLLALDDTCTAVKIPKEIREASRKLGTRLVKIFQPLCNCPAGAFYKDAIARQQAVGHYCIAFGLYAQALQIPKADALSGFYYNAAAGMVTNSVKLIPLGQQEGQELLFSLHPLIEQLVQQSLCPDEDKIGLCCTGFDIRAMQHEQLYSRLYMS
ncbi:MAG TPA: urease accessory protein UreF [Chitinophagaceae bacterium]|jgi:urease accessory protein